VKSLPETVKFMRERRGLSAAKLSRLAGKSPSYITKLERGDLEPSLSAFAAIADVLEFSDAEIAFTVRRAGKEIE
jgi:transcriptional regulator with XRE-family HTH domain